MKLGIPSSSSSSSSTLSPLAEPFSVDRSTIPKPELEPTPPVMEGPYDHRPTSSLGNWLHLHPPTSTPDAFAHPSSDSDMIRCFGGPSINSGDSINTFKSWPMMMENARANPTEAEPYNLRHPTAVRENLVLGESGEGRAGTLEASSQIDHGQSSSDFGYRSNWRTGLWGGASDVEHAQKNDFDLGLSWKEQAAKLLRMHYESSLKHGGPGAEEFVACDKAPPDVWHGVHGEPYATELHMRPKGAGSEWVGNSFSAISTESTSDPSFNVSKSSKEQVPLMKTWHPFNQNASYDRCFIPINSWTEDRTIFYPSMTKAFSSGHVFDLPASGSSSTDRPLDACNNNMDSSNGKASTAQLHAGGNDGYAGNDGYSGTSGIDNDLKWNGNLLVGSSQMKYDVPLSPELFPSWRPCSQTDKSELAQWKIQTALNYIPGSAGQCDWAGSSSKAFNQINPTVDLPFWKGAPASQRSPFRLSGIDECGGFNKQNQTPINVDVAEVAFSPKPHGSSLYHETGSVKDAFSSFSSQPPTVVGCMCTGRLSTDAYITGSDCSKVGNESGFRSSNGMQESGNNHVLLVVPNPKTFDGMPLSHEEDTIASVTQPALEARVADPRKDFDGAAHDVSSDFFSHASVSTGISGMLDSSSEPLLPRLDAQVLVKMIHNLSQLLVSNHYCDANALEECDYDVLMLAIRNLDAWSTKKVGLMRSMLDSNHELGSSYFLRKSTEASKGTAPCRSPDIGIEAGDIPGLCTHDREGKMNSHKPMKEVNKVHIVSVGADMGFEKDDGMDQAIKKSMKESTCDQGEKLPQTLLFKDLWIEAEAALCSMKYELRLARMNIEMEKNKQRAAEDKDSHNTLTATCKSRNLEKSMSLNANDGSNRYDASLPKPKQSLTENVHDVRQSSCEKSQDMNPSDMNGQMEDDEASVMARFQVLKNLLKIRADNKAAQQLPDLIDVGGVSMEIRDSEPELHVKQEYHPTMLVDLGSAETIKTLPLLRDPLEDGSLEVTDTVNYASEIGLGSDALEQTEMTRECGVSEDGIVAQLYTRAWVRTQLPSDACDSPSSDWEHVLKEELPW